MAAKPSLRHHKAEGKWTGDYYCSVCGQYFKPMLGNPQQLQNEFAEHVKREHPAEDVNQAAARIVNEITRDK